MNKTYTLFASYLFFACFYLNAQQTIQVTSNLITPPCNDDAVANVTINGGVEPYTVYWLLFGGENPGMVNFDTVATGQTATGLMPGYYQIHVYDANGVQGFGGIYIQPPFQAFHTVTAATCSNSDGMAKITINNTTGPYSYVWSTGQINLNQTSNMDSVMNIPAGSYSVVISNGEGCSYTYGGSASGTSNQGITVWANSPIQSTSTATPSNCFDGTATVNPTNGTAPYTYLWNTNPAQMSQTATGLSPGTYQCLITDDAGCTRSAWVTVPAGPNFLQSTASVVNPICTQSNGSITISVSGGQAPHTISWSTGANGNVLSNVPAGFYSATITDAAGCSLQVHKSLTSSSPVTVTISTTPASCNNTGATATANVSGGQSPYTFSWNGGGSTAMLNNLSSGFYFVTVTDANGCTANAHANNPLPQSCFGVISGRVISDLNGDCALNGNESGIANVLINASPGFHYATTNAQGFYSISVPPGDYQVHQYVPNNWTQLCPSGDIAVSVSL